MDALIIPYLRRRRSPDVTPEMAAKIRTMLRLGMTQHDIASHFRVNQGRVSEIKTGIHRYAFVDPAPVEALYG